ncbi:hypothetical protein BDZ89DRAFT_1011776 [Hymenopellis radicata]|nr:hypothetical protein BDZ89DRAFT_1011776 [Hymenopellis radicata]
MAPKRSNARLYVGSDPSDVSDNDNEPIVESEEEDSPEEEEPEPEDGEEEEGTARVNVTVLPDEEEAQSDMDIEEEDAEDDELSNESSSQAQPSGSRLKIKLKLPVVPASSTSNTATPVPEEFRQVNPSKRSSGRTRRVVAAYLESSEDEVSDEDMSISEEESTQASPNKRLTSRQAALANAVEPPSHVSLTGDATPGRTSRKKQLNETELALRREETARKRKNMTEKKLQDEKAETINRLLKKQSRPRAKRAGNAPTPRADASKADSGEEEMDVDEAPVVIPEPQIPTMYRWVSTSRPPRDGMDVEGKMSLAFAIPPSLLSEIPPPPVIKAKPLCAVEGCGSERKYRLVRDWERGACGMSHLKILEAS